MSLPGPQQPTPVSSADIDSEIGALYVRYGALAGRLATSIRLSTTEAEMAQVHKQSWEIWEANPSKYPTTIPREARTEEEAVFWAKCQRLTPEEKEDKPLTPLERALQYLVCFAAQSTIRQLYFKDEGRRKLLLSKWSHEVSMQNIAYEIKVGVKPQPHPKPYEKETHGQRPRPLHAWCGCNVRLLDGKSPTAKKYLVDDIVSSHNDGVTVRLKDLQTNEFSHLSQEDFEKMIEISQSRLGEITIEDD